MLVVIVVVVVVLLLQVVAVVRVVVAVVAAVAYRCHYPGLYSCKHLVPPALPGTFSALPHYRGAECGVCYSQLPPLPWSFIRYALRYLRYPGHTH